MGNGNLEVLFFDLGNTLMYFDASLDEVSAEANRNLYRRLAEFGIHVSESEFVRTYAEFVFQSNQERNESLIEKTALQTINCTLEYLAAHRFTEDQIKEALKSYFSSFQEHWMIGDDTHTTLETLKGWGYRMGVISNASDREDVRVLMKKGGLESFFEQVIVSAEEGVRKPHPRIFQKGLDAFGKAPDQCAMIGDTLSADILGANQLGITSIWMDRWADTVENRALKENIKSEATISKLSEIPNLLKKKGKKSKLGG
jgi:HAD superfamily hydrolase (TIGR01549 family)